MGFEGRGGVASEDRDLELSIDTRLVELLYTASPPTIVASMVVATLVVIVLQDDAPKRFLYTWLLLSVLISLLRFVLVYKWHHRDPGDDRPRRWARWYALGTLLAGANWGCSILFLSGDLPLIHQLFVLVVLVGLPIAAMPGDSVFMPVYAAFAVPIVIGLAYWSLLVPGPLALQFPLVAAAYGAVLWITARSYHERLRSSIEIGLTNEQLVKQLSQSNRRLEEMAYIDPLTGLSNRRWFQIEAQQELDRCMRSGRSIALLLIDLDNFKQVNDTLGHDAGDELLKVVGRRLKESLRHTDAVARNVGAAARFGGDEFTVLLEDVDGRVGVTLAAQRILDELGRRIQLGNGEWELSASIGIALFPGHSEKLGELMRGADIAMYRAKKQGRNRYCFFDPQGMAG